MKNHVQPGRTVTLPAPAGGVTSGDGVLVGSIFGIASTTALAGEMVAITVTDVWTLPKATGAITVGAKLYWDATNKVVTTTASGNSLIGAATSAALSGDATVPVRLNGVTV
jgi:predicted RecA/RadA family phage recombinase